MGSCAGCANPQRRYQPPQLKANKINKNKYQRLETIPKQQIEKNGKINYYGMIQQSLGIAKRQSKQQNTADRTKNNQNLIKNNPSPKSNIQPWKNKIVGRTISKYIKPTTLKQDQQNSSSLNNVDSKQNIFNFAQMPLFGKSFPKQEVYESQVRDHHASVGNKTDQELENQLKQIFTNNNNKARIENRITFGSEDQSIDHPQRVYTLNSPVNKMQISLFSDKYQMSSVVGTNYLSYEGESSIFNENSSTALNNHYLPVKKTAYLDEQLSIINEIFDRETETPGYVRGLKIESGEDIRYDNIGQQDAIPDVIEDPKIISEIEEYLKVMF